MPKNWKTYKLGDVATLQRGFDLPSRKRKHGTYPVIAASGFSTWHNDYKVKGPGVTTGRSGTLGQVFYEENDFWPLNTSLWVKDFNHNDPKFIYYFLQTLNFQEYNTGTSVPTLNRNDVHNLDVQIPKLPEQKAIASILSAIDDKIENNLAINKTLEDMAMALYKHWFVDFGPFQDGEFIDSELGPIPKGWEVRRLDEVARVNANSIKKGKAPSVINYIDIASVKKGFIEEIKTMDFVDAPSRARRIISDGDIVWSTVRPNRESRFLSLGNKQNTIVSTGFAVITPISVNYSFLYLSSCTEDFVDYLVSRATGSSYPAVTGKIFESSKLSIPSKEILEAFNKIVEPMFIKSSLNSIENRSLTKLRDSLLPKLISGELRLKEFQNQIETVITRTKDEVIS